MTTLAQAERDLVAAVLDDRTVQYSEKHDSTWSDLDARGFFDHIANPRVDYEYRVKPESDVSWLPVYRPLEGHNGLYVGGAWSQKRYAQEHKLNDNAPAAILRVELDPDSLAVISAVTEAV